MQWCECGNLTSCFDLVKGLVSSVKGLARTFNWRIKLRNLFADL